ncbi:MAG: hypothetical protein ACPG4T_01755 [Nannocystaceae bacterium]
MHAITSEFEQLLAQMLWLEAGTHGWYLASHEIASQGIQARYQHARGFQVSLQLVHPSVPVKRQGGRTKKFQIVAVSATRGLNPTPLIDWVTRRVAQLEAGFSWSEVENLREAPSGELHLDSEGIAVRAGIKPCMRITIEREGVAALVERLQTEKLYVQIVGQGVDYGDGTCETLCISTDPARAAALCAAEQRLGACEKAKPDASELAEIYSEIGAHLGYPPCCVAAFAGRAALDRSGGAGVSMPYHAAREAWVARPFARLNNLHFGAGIQFISFEPCRYDCQAAQQLADAIADAVGATCQRSLAHIDQRLARPVAIASSGERFEAVLEHRDGPTMVACTHIPRWRGRPSPSTLSVPLRGAIDTCGQLANSGNPPVLVLDFHPS